MSTVEEMISRSRELESIASNPANDATTRYRAQDERMNLVLLIQKDQQRQFEKQNARIKSDEERTAKIEAVRAEMDKVSNSLHDINSNDVAGREAISDRLLSLNLELQKLLTFKE